MKTYLGRMLACVGLLATVGANAVVFPLDGDDQDWFADGYLAIKVSTDAGYAPDTVFGYYTGSVGEGAEYTPIFDGDSDPVGSEATIALGVGVYFGFYLDSSEYSGGGLFHSRVDDNQDGVDHLLTEDLGGGVYLLKWEDLAGGGDRDYNDLVVRVEGTASVPDGGSTLALLGLGVLGFAAFRRR